MRKRICPKCPECGSKKTFWKEDKRIYCRECKRRYSIKETKNDYPITPSVLLLDIETAPATATVWGFWNQNIHLEQVISDWYCISWAAKWLNKDNVMGDVLKPKEAIIQDDKRIMKSIYNLIQKADIVIAHNADRFDIPKLKLRFLAHGFAPPHPFQIIDTLKVWKREFGSNSNKLDFINGFVLNLPRKIETGGMELWRKCMLGDSEALNKMLEYNKNDVYILEKNYLAVRGWVHSHPNLSLYKSSTVCTNCGSSNIKEEKNVFYWTSVSKFQVYRCLDCQTPFRGRHNLLTKEEKNKILTPCAR